MKMKINVLLIVLLLFAIICVDGKLRMIRIRGGSSSRGSSRRTASNPTPTSMSHAQPSAPKPAQKPSLSGWQEKSAPVKQKQSKPTQTHSYPSSNTGLSGNGNSQAKQPARTQDNIQRSSGTQTHAFGQSQANNQQPSYPASKGLSGNTGTGNVAGYPQQQGGLSGSGGAAPPPYSAAGGHQGPPPLYSNANNYPRQQGTGLSGSGGAPPPYGGAVGGYHPSSNYGGNNYHPQGNPPPYGSHHGGNHGGAYGQGSQMPGYFGNYGNNGRGFGGVSRSSGPSMLTGVGIAGAGIGTVLTGLALWNLARSTGRSHHTVIYDNRGQPVAVAPSNDTSEPTIDAMLGELVNCSLTISNDNATEVLAIPCAIATSFTPDADVKDMEGNKNPNDNTKCTVGVLTKTGKEYMTTIPCSILLNTAAENNVTEPPPLAVSNGTDVETPMAAPIEMSAANPPQAFELTTTVDGKLDCVPEPGDVRDPINPCLSVSHNLTVIPLQTTPNGVQSFTSPPSA